MKEAITKLQKISWLFPVFSGFIIIYCVVYCLFWWKPHPMTIFDIDCSIVCWNFCRTMSIFWAAVAIMIASLSIISGILFKFKSSYAVVLMALTGVLTLPVGILPLFTVWLHLRS
ncbi:MAG: hypothetical protein ACE5KZ_14760 [Candidatus Scalinduaceae bacterium]